MNMIGHDDPANQLVVSTLIVVKRTFHYFGYTFVTEETLSIATIFIVINQLTQLHLYILILWSAEGTAGDLARIIDLLVRTAGDPARIIDLLIGTAGDPARIISAITHVLAIIVFAGEVARVPFVRQGILPLVNDFSRDGVVEPDCYNLQHFVLNVRKIASTMKVWNVCYRRGADLIHIVRINWWTGFADGVARTPFLCKGNDFK